MPQREKAWNIRPYPCIGLGLFLSSMISATPAYPTIVAKMKDGGSMLDVGCALGTDLRQLTFDGAPSDQMYAVDIVRFWDLGYELFHDRQMFHAKFLECDVLAPNAELTSLHGKFDIIWICHVLHEWVWDAQVKAVKQLVALSKPGAMVAGYQGGTLNPRIRKYETNGVKAEWYMHDDKTFQKLWAQAGVETGTRWRTDTKLRMPGELPGYNGSNDVKYLGEDFRFLEFVSYGSVGK